MCGERTWQSEVREANRFGGGKKMLEGPNLIAERGSWQADDVEEERRGARRA